MKVDSDRQQEAATEPTQTVLPTDLREASAGLRGPGDDDSLPGAETVGRYAILAHLGTGGMGSVYTAYDPDLDRKVALKLVRQDRANPDEQIHLLREAQALAKLSHPNVVQVYDVGWHGDQVFFAMELVSGLNLWQWLRAQPRPWRRVLQLFRSVARGLVAAHDQGLVHRDLKPENILVGEDGQATIADFGLVKSLKGSSIGVQVAGSSTPSAPDSDRPRDRPGGTPAYMAPEFLDGSPATELSDQYSFCVALHVALYGERPSAARSSPMARPWPPWRWKDRIADRSVPAWLRRVLLRGLSPDPGDRYPSMRALLGDLLQIATRRRRRVAMASALILAGASGWLLTSTRPSSPPPCGGGGERFGEVWNPERRQALIEAFRGIGSPFAVKAAERTSFVLDRYGENWITSYQENCLATRVRGEQSERVMDLRMLCLERRREEARTLTQLLLAGDERMVSEAVQAAEALSHLSACDAGAELALISPLPDDAGKRQAIETLQARLADHRVRHKTGQKVDIAALEQTIEEIEGTGYAPLLADGRRQLGDILLDQPESVDSAVEALEGALEAAIAGGHRESTAIIYGRLAELTGYYQGDPQRGAWWGRFAAAALAGLGPGHDEARILLRSSLGTLDWSVGRPAEARAHFLDALKLAEEVWGEDSSYITQILNNLALVSSSPAESMLYLERALSIKEEVLGPANPLLANTLVNLGARKGDEGDYGAGLAYAARAAEILELSYSEEVPTLAYPLCLEGELLSRLDRPEEASVKLERALALAQGFAEGHGLRIQLLFDLTDTRLLQLRLVEAEEFHRRAVAQAADYPPESPFRAQAQFLHGQLLLHRGDSRRALAAFQDATALAKVAELPLPSWQEISAQVGIGEAQLGRGRPDLARPILEEALRNAEGAPNDAPLAAAAHFALARAVLEEDSQRGRELASRAAALLPASGSPATRRLADQIEVWLGQWGASPPPDLGR